MTITVLPARNEYTANSGQTIFNYTFKIFADTDLNVYVTPAGAACDDSTDLTTAYTVTGVGDEDGGTITLTTPTSLGDLVTIVSDVPSSRTTDYQNNGDFRPEVVNADFDRVVSIAKKIEDTVNRGLALPQCQQGPKPLSLPEPQAGRQVRWNGDESGLENVDPASSQPLEQDEIRVYSTVAAMKLDVISSGRTVKTQGYHLSGDAGSAEYLSRGIGWPVVADGFGDHADAGGNFLELQKKAEVNVAQYGANGSADTAAINAAGVEAEKIGARLIGPKLSVPYELDSPLDLRGVESIRFDGDIDTSLVVGAIALTLGGFSQTGVPDIKFADVTDGTSLIVGPTPPQPVVRVWGAKGGRFEFGACNYLQLYADAAEPTGTSNAYNKFYLNGVCRRLEIASAPGFSWITENDFYNGRIIEYRIVNGGGYPHNHNKLYNPTFEGSQVNIEFLGVTANWVYGGRFENTASASVTFDTDSLSNTIERTFTGTGQTRSCFENDFIQVTDNGKGNDVTTEWAYKFEAVPLGSINSASGIVASASNSASAYNKRVLPGLRFAGLNGGNQATPGLAKVAISANTWALLSDVIPVKNGDAVAFDFEYDGNLMRPSIFVYDANMRPLTSEGVDGAFWSQIGVSFNAGLGAYLATSDQSSARRIGSVARPEVKYIRVGLWSSAGGDLTNASLTLYVQSVARAKAISEALQTDSTLAIAGAPTKGYLRLNEIVVDTSSGAFNRVSYQHETTLSAGASGGATSVTVTLPESIADGDIVGILLDDLTTHWSVVSGLVGSTFTVDALPSAAAAGNRVVFNRWVTLP